MSVERVSIEDRTPSGPEGRTSSVVVQIIRSVTTGRIVFLILLWGVWQVVYEFVGQPALASPAQSVDSLLATANVWLPDLRVTLESLALSVAITFVGGIAIGFLIGLSSFWSEVLNPLVLAAYSVPKVTLYPIFLLVFGLTLEGRVAFSVLHGVLPLIIVCADAGRNVPTILLKVAHTYNMSFSGRLRFIVIPAVMPSVIGGLRMALNLCFLGLVTAEIFAAYAGLGFRLITYSSSGRMSEMLGVVLVILALALLLTGLMLRLESRHERRLGRVVNPPAS